MAATCGLRLLATGELMKGDLQNASGFYKSFVPGTLEIVVSLGGHWVTKRPHEFEYNVRVTWSL